MTNLHRRDFLTCAGAAGALGLAGSLLRGSAAHAGPPAAARTVGSARKLVLVMAQGGWDTTIALDPKVQSTRVDVAPGVTKTFGQTRIHTNADAWPAVESYFAAYGAQTAVVRGITVSSVSHRECVTRMSTGTRDPANGDLGAVVAHDLGVNRPLPYLVLGDTAFTGPYAVSSGRIGATNQILALLDPSQGYPTGTTFAPSAAEQTMIERYSQASLTRARATRGSTGYNARRLDDYATAIAHGEQLKRVRTGFGRRGATLALDSQVDLAVTALQQDISQAVMLNTRLAWDTHTDNDVDQATFHQEAFTALARLMGKLGATAGSGGGTLLDETVVVMYSEFSRTPRRNADGGKDHWPVTSAVVAGAGIAGGRSYGATTADVQAEQIDLATGAISPAGTTLTSQQFVGGVMLACGVDPQPHLGTSEVLDAFVA